MSRRGLFFSIYSRLKSPEVDSGAPSKLDLYFAVYESGLVSDASGSGYVEQGNTKIVAAVFGPREVTRRKEFSLKAQLR